MNINTIYYSMHSLAILLGHCLVFPLQYAQFQCSHCSVRFLSLADRNGTQFFLLLLTIHLKVH